MTARHLIEIAERWGEERGVDVSDLVERLRTAPDPSPLPPPPPRHERWIMRLELKLRVARMDVDRYADMIAHPTSDRARRYARACGDTAAARGLLDAQERVARLKDEIHFQRAGTNTEAGVT